MEFAGFQSPDGDSLCPDGSGCKSGRNCWLSVFQSPDGDSLCPDDRCFGGECSYAGGFSPLTGILYVRTDGTARH